MHLVVPPHIAQIRLRSMRDLCPQIRQLNRLSPQFPLVPFVGFDDVGFVEVRVCLCAAVAFGDRFLDHLALVFALMKKNMITC